jgi:hypothetical protein
LSQLQHPNVAGWVGFVFEASNLAIVTLYCDGNDLQNMLEDEKLSARLRPAFGEIATQLCTVQIHKHPTMVSISKLWSIQLQGPGLHALKGCNSWKSEAKQRDPVRQSLRENWIPIKGNTNGVVSVI